MSDVHCVRAVARRIAARVLTRASARCAGVATASAS